MSGEEKADANSYISSSKGHKLFCKYWGDDNNSGDNPVKALVFILHGFAEHCEAYEYLVKILTSHGYYVCAHDHVGHGKSEGQRAQIYNFMDYVNDLFIHIETVKQRFPSIPVFLVGHSMGGTISIRAALEKPEFFKGVVLISPLIEIDKKTATTPKILLGKLVSRLFPDLHLGNLDPALISRDPDVVQQYKNDPLNYHNGMKSRIGMVLYDTLNDLKLKLTDVTWPFLALHGTKDGVTDIEGTKLLHEKAKSTDKELKIFTDAYHQLHKDIEPVRSETCNAIAEWLDVRC